MLGFVCMYVCVRTPVRMYVCMHARMYARMQKHLAHANAAAEKWRSYLKKGERGDALDKVCKWYASKVEGLRELTPGKIELFIAYDGWPASYHEWIPLSSYRYVAFVWMCTYVCVCVYVCMHVCTYVMYACMYVCMWPARAISLE